MLTKLMFPVLLTSIIALFSTNLYAQNKLLADTTTTVTTTATPSGTIERKTIVTTVPAAKEVIVTPTGYVNCFTVDAGWFNEEWIPAHRICQYANSPEGVAWVEGYWSCTQYKVESNECTNWVWKPAHWSKALEVY